MSNLAEPSHSRPGAYWENCGTFQRAADMLVRLVPNEGAIRRHENARLERFRVASNAYYDLFNNGGCNRPDDIVDLLGVPAEMLDRDWEAEEAYRYTEPAMDRVVADAVAEQVKKIRRFELYADRGRDE